jgi:hypothetical protein
LEVQAEHVRDHLDQPVQRGPEREVVGHFQEVNALIY